MITLVKSFIEWMSVKSGLNAEDHKPPFFVEREVWWCSIGENIGNEICGKGGRFKRPVLILRKLDAYTFIGAPLTKTYRTGSWYEQVIIGGVSNTVIIAQVRHLDYRRIDKKLCTLSQDDFKRIRASFIRLFS